MVFADLSKRYDARTALRPVSGEAKPGEVLAITGPNGSGKSTLLAILCGVLRPTRGSLTYLEGNGGEVPREEWRRLIGVVAPAMSVYEELSAMENLRFFSRLRGLDGVEERSRGCLQAVGLDPERSTPVRGFSTGMLQRLKIAQALLHEPPVLMFDEPGSNLDLAGQEWLAGLVQSSAEAGKTVVLATNDRQEMEWGHRHVALAV